MSGAVLRRAFGDARRPHRFHAAVRALRDERRGVVRRLCSGERKSPSATRGGGSSEAGRLQHTDVNVATHAHHDVRTTLTPEMEQSIFTETPLIFDTHRMIAFLRQAGFPQVQSEAITDAMVRVSQHANRHHQNQMVTKNEFVSLRSELSILEKADFALLKTDINAIEKRMETSVAEIYTAVERVENRVIKWVIAVAGAIGLAIIRLTTTSGGGASKSAVPPPASNVDHSLVPRGVQRNDKRILVT